MDVVNHNITEKERRVMRRRISIVLAVLLLVLPLLTSSVFGAPGDFSPTPATQTAYSKSFLTACEGQQWFINELERLLNMEQKTLNTVTSPTDFANIKSLGFADKNINGKIPKALGELTELQYLFMSGNKLSGVIPAELFTLSKLQNIDLSDNNYTGGIPEAFGDMPSLTSLTLKNNGFTGNIPAKILANDNITVLNLLNNKLSGGVPADISGMTSLQYLNISKNALGGELPDLTGLTSLKALSLWGCGLTGEIDSSIYSLTSLQILDLAENSFTGELSSSLSGLTNLQFLSLASNKLTGTLTDVFPASIKELHLENNRLRGHVPATLKTKADNGTAIYLMDNYLTGSVLLSMLNNDRNFTDGATNEQYKLTSTQATVQVYEDKEINLYPLLRNQAIKSGSPAKPVLAPDEYTLTYNSSVVTVTVTASGIQIKALTEITKADNEIITITIKDNTGSDYSTVKIQLTTEAVIVSGGGGGGGGGGETASTHEPYINGYPDGSFKADNNVSREEVSKMLMVALKLGESSANSPSYTDVEVSRWSFGYIEKATELGYLNGYGNGIFNPADSMTRAELATVLVRIAEKQGNSQSNPSRSFSDVTGTEWYGEYIAKAVRFGLITGYEDGTFRPNNTVSRAEAVTMINRMLGRNPNTAPDLATKANPFNDLSRSHWAYLQVLEASLTHEH